MLLALKIVGLDLTVRVNGMRYALPPREGCRALIGQQVRVYYCKEDPEAVKVVFMDAQYIADRVAVECSGEALPVLFPTRPVLMEIHDMTGMGVVDSLAKGGHIRIHTEGHGNPDPAPEPEADLPVCPLCGHVTTELQTETTLEQDVCAVCHLAAGKILNRFRRAQMKTEEEFRSQLGQMVMDVRAGMDEPTFYQGFE